MNTVSYVLAAMAIMSLVSTAAEAGDHHHHVPSHAKHAKASSSSASTKAYKAGMEKMHHKMMIAYTHDTDMDFAAGMVPHHEGAVAMAEVELKYGTDPAMRKLAENIIAFQKAEIAEMQHWLGVRNYPQGAAPSERGKTAAAEFKRTMEVMHHGMNIDYTGNADIDFARGMIPHHQGGIDMAMVERRYGLNPQMTRLAGNIVGAQKQEIALMRSWLKSQGVDAPPPTVTPDLH